MFDIVNKFNGKPLLCTRELMQQTMQSAAVVETCQAIAKLVKTKISEVERQIAATSEPGELADLERSEKALWEEVARLKKRLPAFCFQAHYTDGRRRNKSAQKSGLCMFDIDDLQDARATTKSRQTGCRRWAWHWYTSLPPHADCGMYSAPPKA